MEKKLSTVTEQDAIEILSACPNYKAFFRTDRWRLSDESVGVGEPCKKFQSPRKAYFFWFMDDCIDIELTDEMSWDMANVDVKFMCYLKAVQLGYYVPSLTELLTNPL